MNMTRRAIKHYEYKLNIYRIEENLKENIKGEEEIK